METVNQGINTEGAEKKTFSQAEVDEIVSERLKRERSKYADYESLKDKAAKFDQVEEANKTELQKATERAAALQLQLDKFTKANELRTIREKVATEMNIPVNLLTGEDEETCKAQAEAMLKWAQSPAPYPSVKDAGESKKVSGKSTRDDFAAWFEAAEKN